jgi:hypothetical protein
MDLWIEVGRKVFLRTYRANGLWKGYNRSLHIYCVGAGERVSCRWAEGMGANNCAMDLAGDKFDKAHYVESCKGAQIVEETCLQVNRFQIGGRIGIGKAVLDQVEQYLPRPL